jgi:hypothetical protein
VLTGGAVRRGRHSRRAALNADPNALNFGETVQSFVLPGGPNDNLALLATSPDNVHLAAFDQSLLSTSVFDVTDAADGKIPLAVSTITGRTIVDMQFSPTGLTLYLGDFPNNQVLGVNMDPANAQFGVITSIVAIPGGTPTETPTAIALTPDGATLYTITQQLQGPMTRSLYHWMVDPFGGGATSTPTQTAFVGGGPQRLDNFVISPRGDTAWRAQTSASLTTGHGG